MTEEKARYEFAKEHLELTAPLQNSIEIGETSKGDLYVKSIKRYHGPLKEDLECALGLLLATYDKVREEINARKG